MYHFSLRIITAGLSLPAKNAKMGVMNKGIQERRERPRLCWVSCLRAHLSPKARRHMSDMPVACVRALSDACHAHAALCKHHYLMVSSIARSVDGVFFTADKADVD